ncbi:MAG: hypothetical protein M1297_03365 [Nitrospirae bacterium]|nr:hypothetical protein [Nitrospirota bacterium]
MPDSRIAFLLDRAREASGQMEVDAFLLGRMGFGWSRLLRIYRFLGPCVTVGRTYRQDIPPEWREDVRDIAVRPTGGGAVLHGEDLCFSLFLFPRPPVSPRFLYPLVHDWVGQFLKELSVDVSLQSGTPVSPNLRRVCFEEPVCGDLLWKSRKVMGGAIRVTSNGLLYQGSLHVPGFSGRLLEERFFQWYRAVGARELEVRLESEVLVCPA